MRRYGWKRSLPDFRDKRMTGFDHKRWGPLPKETDLREWVPEIYDQELTSSCTSHSYVAAHRIVNKKQGYPDVRPSRLFHYYNERIEEGTTEQDDGAMIRTAVKVGAKYGVCPEDEWEFRQSKMFVHPPEKLYKDAVQSMVKIYFGIDQRLDDFKHCLAVGYPFLLGFMVYESFESNAVARTGKMPMPHTNERAKGGHAVTAVGYNDEQQVFIVQNSWGKTWGDKGFFYMPYDYLLNPGMCDDFWTIREMEVPGEAERRWVVP